MWYSNVNARIIARMGALLIVSGCVEQVAPVQESAFMTTQLDIVSGNSQVGQPGQMLPAPLVVRVTNALGLPVIGQIVNFRVASGGGSVFAGASLTDVNGTARERWTLGTNTSLAQRVEARAVDANGDPVVYGTFTATFTSPPPPPPEPVATVTITPSSDTVQTGATTQLTATTRDAFGTVLTGRTVTWTSQNTAVATVSSSGLVTGVSVGVTGIIATSETKADTATITVIAPPPPPPPPPPANGVADPTLLPAANGARPVSGSYGRNLLAGQTYADPNTGVTVLKVTDASTPNSNGGMDRGYSEGGPHISQPWTGTDGQTYYTLKVADKLVDLRYGTLALINWRNVAADGEVDFAFSLDPSTPRIGYTIEDSGAKRVSRYNTATNRIENTGNWPWVVSASGTSLEWLQNNLNDEWFVGMLNSNHTVVGFRPSDGMQQAFTQTATGLSIDEPHIDREMPVVYLSTNNDAKQNVVAFLETGGTRVPANSSWQSDDHAASLRCMVAGVGHWQRNTDYYYDLLADRTVEFTAASNTIGYPGDYHMAGQWVFNNGSGPAQWFVMDSWGSDYSSAAIRTGMIGIVRMNPFSARLIAAHDSQPSSYESQPQSTISPDGKIVMWTSNMNGKARTDVFLARMPVR